jgi:predicted small metal-binding protein
MSEYQDTKSPEQIQREIQQTRSEMSDTLDAIRDKLSPGEILDQAIAYFRSNSSGSRAGVGETASHWANSLGDTVKQNPVPVALIGAGLAWLMMGGSRHAVRPEPHTHIYDTHNYDTQRATVYGAYNTPASGTHDTHEHSSSLRERARDMASGVQERISAAGERISDAAASARERIGDTAGHLRYQASQQGGKTQETFNYLRDEQPLVLGALGFALGAALGAGLPSTQREDELMGETRDHVLHRAQEIGEEQLDKAKHVASAAGHAALDQAHQEGLTQESADQTLRHATEKIERVANASVEAAKKEADPANKESSHPTSQATSTRTTPRP